MIIGKNSEVIIGMDTLIWGLVFVVCVIMIAVLIAVLEKKRRKNYHEEVASLEREKNLIASTPVPTELSKVEPLIKNEKMEEKYKSWQERFELIKNEKIVKINDMIIDLDLYLDKKDYKTCRYRIAKTELELAKARMKADNLLSEIQEITSSEEKYRAIIIKLKAKYRDLIGTYQSNKPEYDDIGGAIELQFENIEKRFMDFEKAMEQGEYNEVVHIVKALDTMVEHMSIVIEEVPNLILMGTKLIPIRVEQLQEAYDIMVEQEYPLEYLKVPYNLEETTKNVNSVMDRIRVLNLEDCMFELKTMLDYLDSLFTDFEKEKLARKVYEDINKDFKIKLKKVTKVVADIYNQLDHIRTMYDLKDEEVKSLDTVRLDILTITKDYKLLNQSLKKKDVPYSKSHKDIEDLTIRLKEIEERLDQSIKNLGSMYDDEARAREQLDEIQELLKECKKKIRSFKLPVITDMYFVQLEEANDAIYEIIKELEKKPIEIKVLNTRVDTARDLVLKLYNTTNDMIKTARLAEKAIVYGNRYLALDEIIESGIKKAEISFYKGKYKEALEDSVKAIELVEPDIYGKLLSLYEN